MPACIKRLQRAAIATNNTAGADEIELLTVLTTWIMKGQNRTDPPRVPTWGFSGGK